MISLATQNDFEEFLEHEVFYKHTHALFHYHYYYNIKQQQHNDNFVSLPQILQIYTNTLYITIPNIIWT